jgi:beta-glucosidase/6-phospho-beta-glucosidase/beta-galactosidase
VVRTCKRQSGRCCRSRETTTVRCESFRHKSTTKKSNCFQFGLFANPIINFDFPKVVVDRVAERSKLEDFPRSRLPQFTFAEKLNVKGTYDFLGLNHYTTWLVSDDEEPSLDQSGFYIDTKVARQQDPAWEKTAVDDNRVQMYA